MAIFNLLSNYGEFSTSSSFNGLLRDYLTDYQDEYKDIFEKLLQIDGNIWVYHNYSLNIQHQLISNKKIGYRDIEKVPSGTIKIPYLIYWEKPFSRCMLLTDEDYIIARGMYYCASEPGNDLEKDKVEIISLSLKQQYNDIVEIFESLRQENCTPGYLQRRFDSTYFGDMESSKDHCVELSSKMFGQAKTKLAELETDKKAAIIYKVVANGFFLKKALYVRYMSNKSILAERHDNNVYEQRKFAKAYIDEIGIIPFYQLWH